MLRISTSVVTFSFLRIDPNVNTINTPKSTAPKGSSPLTNHIIKTLILFDLSLFVFIEKNSNMQVPLFVKKKKIKNLKSCIGLRPLK